MFASPERDLLFDINDFDETLPGPFEFDLKRLATSLVVAGREIGVIGHDARHMVHRAMRSYRERMTGYSTMPAIDVYYARVDATGILAYADKGARAMLEGTVKSTAHHDAIHELPKLTAIVDGKRRIVEHPPILIKLPELNHMLADVALRAYRETLREDLRVLLERYRLVDFALKVVGVGSVGLEAFVGLFIGTLGRRPAVPPGQAGGGVRATSGTWDRARRAATASGWSRVSVASRRPATSSSAGPSASGASTRTSGSSRTRRAARSSTR